MTIITNGSTIYDRHGEKLGTVHVSTRSRRWYFKQGRDVSAAKYFDGEQAADALRKTAEVRV